MRLRRAWTVAVLAAVAGLASACGADYDERMEYLREVALRGAETHGLIISSEGKPDRERCEAAYDGLNEDPPYDQPMGNYTQAWHDQVKLFFVDSCLSGKPKELPQRGAPVSPSPVPTDSSPSLSVSQSAVPSVTP